MDLRDRVALVTGASGGLGAVTACMLAEDGVHVAVTHLGHRDEALDVCKQIEAMGRKAIPVHLDQTDPASCGAAVEATPSGAWVASTSSSTPLGTTPYRFRTWMR